MQATGDWQCAFAYNNRTVVFLKSSGKHSRQVENVLQLLGKAKMTKNWEGVHFFVYPSTTWVILSPQIMYSSLLGPQKLSQLSSIWFWFPKYDQFLNCLMEIDFSF